MANKKTFPTLFKRTSAGSIQQWDIGVERSTIVTIFGQVGGKMQTTSRTISSGKNQGRKNETGPESQANLEAEAMWLKKKKAGYVENLKDAESGKTDKIIKGGIAPMLAKVYEDHSKKIKDDNFFVQPKLDGLRCIAIVNPNEVSLWTRTRKRITSCEHIEKELKKFQKDSGFDGILDGELYTDVYKSDFEKIVSAVRKIEHTEDALMIDYHIYDVVSPLSFGERFVKNEYLHTIDFGKMGKRRKHGYEREYYKHLKIVETISEIDLPENLEAYHDYCVGEGYEGVMVRHSDRGYENKRSDQLLKLKVFQDGEFEIVGVIEGEGKLKGHAGSFICKLDKKSDKTFDVKMSGETSKLKEYFINFDKYKNKYITVQYQGFTNTGRPRFPVGLRFRDKDF